MRNDWFASEILLQMPHMRTRTLAQRLKAISEEFMERAEQ